MLAAEAGRDTVRKGRRGRIATTIPCRGVERRTKSRGSFMSGPRMMHHAVAQACLATRSATMPTLYDCATAPSPRRARILLAEKGIAHDTVAVDLMKGEQFGDAYRQINPQCTVPALRTDDGLLLTDNAGITAWLEAQYPQPPLLGSTPAEKAEIASWN
jgi:hypothetical protein